MLKYMYMLKYIYIYIFKLSDVYPLEKISSLIFVF